MYQLTVTVELARLDAKGAMDWRGSGKIQTVADLASMLDLVQSDGIANGVQRLAQRIVTEENAKHHNA